MAARGSGGFLKEAFSQLGLPYGVLLGLLYKITIKGSTVSGVLYRNIERAAVLLL